jgi:hypothetical protein
MATTSARLVETEAHPFIPTLETQSPSGQIDAGAGSDDSSERQVTHEEIARLAYECWQERGCPEGSPEIDWYLAEQNLSNRDPQS